MAAFELNLSQRQSPQPESERVVDMPILSPLELGVTVKDSIRAYLTKPDDEGWFATPTVGYAGSDEQFYRFDLLTTVGSKDPYKNLIIREILDPKHSQKRRDSYHFDNRVAELLFVLDPTLKKATEILSTLKTQESESSSDLQLALTAIFEASKAVIRSEHPSLDNEAKEQFFLSFWELLKKQAPADRNAFLQKHLDELLADNGFSHVVFPWKKLLPDLATITNVDEEAFAITPAQMRKIAINCTEKECQTLFGDKQDQFGVDLLFQIASGTQISSKDLVTTSQLFDKLTARQKRNALPHLLNYTLTVNAAINARDPKELGLTTYIPQASELEPLFSRLSTLLVKGKAGPLTDITRQHANLLLAVATTPESYLNTFENQAKVVGILLPHLTPEVIEQARQELPNIMPTDWFSGLEVIPGYWLAPSESQTEEESDSSAPRWITWLNTIEDKVLTTALFRRIIEAHYANEDGIEQFTDLILRHSKLTWLLEIHKLENEPLHEMLQSKFTAEALQSPVKRVQILNKTLGTGLSPENITALLDERTVIDFNWVIRNPYITSQAANVYAMHTAESLRQVLDGDFVSFEKQVSNTYYQRIDELFSILIYSPHQTSAREYLSPNPTDLLAWVKKGLRLNGIQKLPLIEDRWFFISRPRDVLIALSQRNCSPNGNYLVNALENLSADERTKNIDTVRQAIDYWLEVGVTDADAKSNRKEILKLLKGTPLYDEFFAKINSKS